MKALNFLVVIFIFLTLVFSCQSKNLKHEKQFSEIAKIESELLKYDSVLMADIHKVIQDSSFRNDESVFKAKGDNSLTFLILDHAYFSRSLGLSERNNYQKNSFFGALDWAIQTNSDNVMQCGLSRLHDLADVDCFYASDKDLHKVDLYLENPLVRKIKEEVESNAHIAFVLVVKTSKFCFEDDHLSVAGLEGYVAVMNRESKAIAAVFPVKAENSRMIDQIITSGESDASIERQVADDFKMQMKFAVANEIRRRYVDDNSMKINVLM